MTCYASMFQTGCADIATARVSVFRVGDTVRNVYVVVSGEVRLFHKRRSSRAVVAGVTADAVEDDDTTATDTNTDPVGGTNRARMPSSRKLRRGGTMSGSRTASPRRTRNLGQRVRRLVQPGQLFGDVEVLLGENTR